jgi:hypothetical protein
LAPVDDEEEQAPVGRSPGGRAGVDIRDRAAEEHFFVIGHVLAAAVHEHRTGTHGIAYIPEHCGALGQCSGLARAMRGRAIPYEEAVVAIRGPSELDISVRSEPDRRAGHRIRHVGTGHGTRCRGLELPIRVEQTRVDARCLVHDEVAAIHRHARPRPFGEARDRLAEIASVGREQHPGLDQRVSLIDGDIPRAERVHVVLTRVHPNGDGQRGIHGVDRRPRQRDGSGAASVPDASTDDARHHGEHPQVHPRADRWHRCTPSPP